MLVFSRKNPVSFFWREWGRSTATTTPPEAQNLATAAVAETQKQASTVYTRQHLWLPAFTLWVICTQDHMHEGAKLRVRFAKTELTLPLGKKVATISDVITLLSCVSKEDHIGHHAGKKNFSLMAIYSLIFGRFQYPVIIYKKFALIIILKLYFFIHYTESLRATRGVRMSEAQLKT